MPFKYWNGFLHELCPESPLSFSMQKDPHFNCRNQDLNALFALLKPSKAKNISSRGIDTSNFFMHATTKEVVSESRDHLEFNYIDRKTRSHEAITALAQFRWFGNVTTAVLPWFLFVYSVSGWQFWASVSTKNFELGMVRARGVGQRVLDRCCAMCHL